MKKDNLPAVKSGSFDLTAGNQDGIVLDPALQEAVDETDHEGYDPNRESLPIVSIRQKPLVDEKSGTTLLEPGGFKIYDAVTADSGGMIPDVKELDLTIMTDQPARIYFPTLTSDKPACRSVGGQQGVGEPGGLCNVCPLSQWQGGKNPKCAAQMNVLVWDHALKTCLVLRFGPSGLKPYGNFKALIGRLGNGTAIPIHALRVKVTTQYQTEPAPHFTPAFSYVDQVPIDLFVELKKLRRELSEAMSRTAAVDTVDEETPVETVGPETGEVLPI